MKKQWLMIMLLGTLGLQGADIVGLKKNTLLAVLKEAESGIAVFYCNDHKETMKQASRQAITDFRENNTARTIDYVFTQDHMFETENGKKVVQSFPSIESIIKYKFYRTSFVRGSVIYVIDADNQKSCEQHCTDITALKVEWPIVVYVNNAKRSDKLDKYFAAQKAVIYGGKVEKTGWGFSNFLMFGGAAVLFVMLCYKLKFLNK